MTKPQLVKVRALFFLFFNILQNKEAASFLTQPRYSLVNPPREGFLSEIDQ